MGPRLVSRGKRNSLIFHLSQIWLQWGRDLLVAESKPASAILMQTRSALQWGRDLLVAESKDCRIDTMRRVVASMGPRLVSRGKPIGKTLIS